MRPAAPAIGLVVVLLLASAAAADVGRFSSFSTTASRSPGQIDFAVDVATTGMVTTGTDSIFAIGLAFPTTGTTTAANTYASILRSGVGPTAFSGSFSLTGVDDATSYKWAVVTFGDLYGGLPTFYLFYFVGYYLYNGCLPVPYFVNTTPGDTGFNYVTCTGTTPPGGPLRDFLASDISSFQATLNWWYYSSSAGTFYPLVANGVAAGRIGPLALEAIPTLAWWGLFAFSAMLITSGVVLIRRA
ncbi:MAG: hypothetical protein MUE90_11850 [Thermoanaerobaculales bacterium]|jgi:hypothetical protein|nr:hypothetical protein [Thermoanaerobaculales bacterium]